MNRKKSQRKGVIVGNGTTISISAASLTGKQPFVSDYLYILGPDGRTPVVTADLTEWALQLENVQKRRVATDEFSFQDEASGTRIEFSVSTVFTGTALNVYEEEWELPDVFETLVSRIDTGESGKVKHEEQEVQCRWSSWDQAAAGHDGILVEIYRGHSGHDGTLLLLESYRPEGSVGSPLEPENWEARGAEPGIMLPMDKLRKLLKARNTKS
jgi:hypothetical protein